MSRLFFLPAYSDIIPLTLDPDLRSHFPEIVITVPGPSTDLIIVAGIFVRVRRTATVIRGGECAPRETRRNDREPDGGRTVCRIDGDDLIGIDGDSIGPEFSLGALRGDRIARVIAVRKGGRSESSDIA